jgi:hypothetical protein
MDVLENFVRNTFGIKIKIKELNEVRSRRNSREFIFIASLEDKILGFWAKSKSGEDFRVAIESGGIFFKEGNITGEVVFSLWAEKERLLVSADEKYFVKMLHK